MKTDFGESKYYTGKDRLILELFHSDPKEAFAQMFEVYHKQLCLYAVQLTDSFSMAEDIVQDLFVIIWEKKIYLSITNLRNYLFLAVRNNAYVLLKKKKLFSMEEIFEIEIHTNEDMFDEDSLLEQEKKIMDELQKLPRQEFATITAVILENKKYKEAAQELGITVNTLKTHLSRALKRLRKLDYLVYILFVV